MIVRREEIFDLLNRLMALKFYGSVTLRFEAGKVVILEKKETIKIKAD